MLYGGQMNQIVHFTREGIGQINENFEKHQRTIDILTERLKTLEEKVSKLEALLHVQAAFNESMEPMIEEMIRLEIQKTKGKKDAK